MKRHRASWGAALGWAALLMACLAGPSCGKVSGPGSGETHFLESCESTCGGGYECLCGMCTLPCDSDAACSGAAEGAVCTATRSCETAAAVCYTTCTSTDDCAALGSDFACVLGSCRQADPAPPVLECDSGCFPVIGYPASPLGTCADLERGEEVACQCGEPATNSACHTRVTDQTDWMVPDGEFADASAWTRCSESTLETLMSSCDFATCRTPANSFCSQDDTCDRLSCGDWQTEEDGCQRTPCESDEDCAFDERCVMLESINLSQCSYSVDGVCNCGGPTIDMPGAFCNPTSEVGQGGEWLGLDVYDHMGSCEFGSCDYEWHVTPDGNVQMLKLGVESSAALSSDDLAELELVINGPEFRRDVDAVACPQGGREVMYALVLSGITHLMGVECFIEGNPENNPYQRIWTVLEKY